MGIPPSPHHQSFAPASPKHLSSLYSTTMLLTLLITLPLLLFVNGQIVVPTSVNSSAVTGPIPTVTIPTTVQTPTPSIGGVTCYVGTDNATTCFGLPTIPFPTSSNSIFNGSLIVTISAPSFSTGASGSAASGTTTPPQLTTKASPTSIASVTATTSQGNHIMAIASFSLALACVAMGIIFQFV